MSDRRGVALIAVLWVVVALGTLAAGATAHARGGTGAIGARVAAIRGRWAAEGCLAAAQARIEEQLRRRRGATPEAVDTIHYQNGASCVVEALDPGTRVHRDSADPATLSRLDSLLNAAGDTALVTKPSFLTSYGDGRVNLAAAGRIVLATLPGFGSETVNAVLSARGWARPITSLDELIARVSPAAREPLIRRYPELAGRVTFRPNSLVLTARGRTAAADGETVVEVFTIPAGERLATIERRTW